MSNPPAHLNNQYYPDHSRLPTTTNRHLYASADVPCNPQNPTNFTYKQHYHPQSQSRIITPADNSVSYPPYHHNRPSTAYPSSQIRAANDPLISPGERLTTSSDDYIQKLRNEVLYLHGLWHHGHPIIPPPNPTNSIPDSQILHSFPRQGHSFPVPVPNFTPNPQVLHNSYHRASLIPPPFTNSNPNPQIIHPLKSSQTTSFKKKNKKKKKKKRKNQQDLLRSISDKEWPVRPQLPDPTSNWCAWPDKKSSSSTFRLPTKEEQVSLSAIRVQQRGLDSFRVLLGGNCGASSPELNSETDSEDEDDDDQARFECFSNIFQVDEELKGYYEQNWEHGDFSCLVCRGIGYKIGKKYKNLVALVQHTVSISKTKRTRAHRTYGQVICKILGWDVNQLPSVFDNPSSELAHEMGDAAHVSMHSSIGVENDKTSTKSDNTESVTAHCVPQALNNSGLAEGESSSYACELTTTEAHEMGDDAHVSMHSSIGAENDSTSTRSDNTESVTAQCIPQALNTCGLAEGESSSHACKLATTEAHGMGDAAHVSMHSSIGAEKDTTSTRSDNTESATAHCVPQALNNSGIAEGESSSLACELATTEGDDASKSVGPLEHGQ